MSAETFGERLRRLRLARNMRVVEVAYAAGITEGAIRQVESGQTKMASLVVGLRLAKLFGVTPDYLATGVENRNEDTGLLHVVLGRLDDQERRLAEVEKRFGPGGPTSPSG